jgi:hypothetical protein
MQAYSFIKCYRGGIVPSKEKVTGGTMTNEEKMTIDEDTNI